MTRQIDGNLENKQKGHLVAMALCDGSRNLINRASCYPIWWFNVLFLGRGLGGRGGGCRKDILFLDFLVFHCDWQSAVA